MWKRNFTLSTTCLTAGWNLNLSLGGVPFKSERSGEADFCSQCPSRHWKQVCPGWSAAGRSLPWVTRIIGKGRKNSNFYRHTPVVHWSLSNSSQYCSPSERYDDCAFGPPVWRRNEGVVRARLGHRCVGCPELHGRSGKLPRLQTSCTCQLACTINSPLFALCFAPSFSLCKVLEIWKKHDYASSTLPSTNTEQTFVKRLSMSTT